MMLFSTASSRNFLVGAVTASVFALLAATGLAMEFVFGEPPGQGRLVDGQHAQHDRHWHDNSINSPQAPTFDRGPVVGNGREAGRGWHGGPSFLGFRKHDFEEIHEWLSYTFLGLVCLHVALHAKWIWSMARGCDPKWQRVRIAFFLGFSCVLVVLVVLPLAIAFYN